MGNMSRYSPRIRGMYRRHNSAAFALASKLFCGLGSELSIKCHYLLTEGRHKELLELSLDVGKYDNADRFRDDYLAVELLSKYPLLRIDVNREKVALETFLEAEKQCSEASDRLSKRYVSGITSPYTPESIIWMARLKIASVLGPFSWDQAEQHFGFGPGSTTSLPRIRGDAYYKYGASKPHVTKACSVLGICAISRIPRWFNHLAGLAGENPETLRGLPLDLQAERLLTFVSGNRVTTVPKNAKTDRTIAIEPDLNMYVQKGIGGLIRNRLLRVGVDLNSQTKNQDLAREGSLTGSLATIDLKSASDTVSMRLVEDLLPEDWVSALKQCRSPYGTLPSGELITYHKVSSMGNGFTFELESLIFWALCSSVITLFRPEEDRLSIYGDDIILSSQLFGTISWILRYCGFTVNPKKSFASGPFRESCGKHFFRGDDVTPFYIREDIRTPDRTIWFANSVRRWARFPTYGLDGRLESCYNLALDYLPSSLRQPSIPDGDLDSYDHLGDIALFGDFDECRPQRSKTLFAWLAVGVSDVRETFVPGEYPYLLRSLASLESRKPTINSSNLSIKRQVEGDMGGASFGVISPAHKRVWRIIKIPITRWESYGEWLKP